jgi:hypothetical protein
MLIFPLKGNTFRPQKNVQHVKHFLSKILLWMTDLSPPGSQHNSSKLNESANAGRDHSRGEAALYVLVSVLTHDCSLVLPVPLAARSKVSAAARLLRLWVRIPPGEWTLSVVIIVCCQVKIFATS